MEEILSLCRQIFDKGKFEAHMDYCGRTDSISIWVAERGASEYLYTKHVATTTEELIDIRSKLKEFLNER